MSTWYAATRAAFNQWRALVRFVRLPDPRPRAGHLWTGQARVEGDQVVLRVSLAALPAILAGTPGLVDEANGEPEVVDLQELGRQLALELESDAIGHLEVHGRSRFQVALDDALLSVVESGSDCVRLPADACALSAEAAATGRI